MELVVMGRTYWTMQWARRLPPRAGIQRCFLDHKWIASFQGSVPDVPKQTSFQDQRQTPRQPVLRPTCSDRCRVVLRHLQPPAGSERRPRRRFLGKRGPASRAPKCQRIRPVLVVSTNPALHRLVMPVTLLCPSHRAVTLRCLVERHESLACPRVWRLDRQAPQIIRFLVPLFACHSKHARPKFTSTPPGPRN